MINNYKDLEVWKKGIDIVDYIYEISDKFPNCELYVLTAQIRRAAISIPSNISEGHVQFTAGYRHSCNIALGSCAEVETQLIIAKRRNYINTEDYKKGELMLEHERRMLIKLIKKLD